MMITLTTIPSCCSDCDAELGYWNVDVETRMSVYREEEWLHMRHSDAQLIDFQMRPHTYALRSDQLPTTELIISHAEICRNATQCNQ